jgi:hypothetical protein
MSQSCYDYPCHSGHQGELCHLSLVKAPQLRGLIRSRLRLCFESGSGGLLPDLWAA